MDYLQQPSPGRTVHTSFHRSLLPQKAPVQNNERMYSYNIPEFVSGPVDLKESVADLFE